MHFSVLEVDLTKNQIAAKTFKKCGTMSSTLFHLSESGKLFIKQKKDKKNIIDRNRDWTLLNVTFLGVHETRMKCIGNCSTANVLWKKFWTRWWRGSISISSEKGKIMERFNCKKLLEKRWRGPRDDPCLMYKPAEKLPWFKEIDTIPDASFVSSVLIEVLL